MSSLTEVDLTAIENRYSPDSKLWGCERVCDDRSCATCRHFSPGDDERAPDWEAVAPECYHPQGGSYHHLMSFPFRGGCKHWERRDGR